MNLTYTYLDTPLGRMVAVADDNALHFLQFADDIDADRSFERLQARTKSSMRLGTNASLLLIAHEMREYFAGTRTTFETPIALVGTEFQVSTWQQLRKISHGGTISYKELAARVGSPSAVRAVGSANGANNLVVIVPCHRVVNTSGALGGYSSGIERKKWLLAHEKSIARKII